MQLFNATCFRSALLLTASLLTACSAQLSPELTEASEQLPELVDLNFHLKPILSDRCFKCHGPDANERKAKLSLDESESAFAKTMGEHSVAKQTLSAGNLKKSDLFHRIISNDPEYMMPPPASNLFLTNEEKALLARWIEQGAEYKPHWSFVPPQKGALPSTITENWVQQPIDHFILNKMERRDLHPSKQADKATLLRRATLDLTGLPPTPTAIDNFLKDPSENAFEKVIDQLLASEQYGERLGVEWLDVARYADSHGYQDDGMRNTWPWRDWVIQKFNENMPYDQFLTEQIAGDLLPYPSRDQLLATCFNRNHPQSQEGGVVEEEYRIEYVADRTNTFGKTLLGITMECARCHDHKYDPISQKDYYSLFAFFNNNNDWGIVPYNGFLPSQHQGVMFRAGDEPVLYLNDPKRIDRESRRRMLDYTVDQPSAALIQDLKRRGMLDDTLVIWGGEFGRGCYSQGKLTPEVYGRDHHPRCFTIWMAGAGIKKGITYGETDEFGYNIARDPVHVHDFQASILHLMGIDHERFTHKFQGRRYRLTDGHGKVVKGILT